MCHYVLGFYIDLANPLSVPML